MFMLLIFASVSFISDLALHVLRSYACLYVCVLMSACVHVHVIVCVCLVCVCACMDVHVCVCAQRGEVSECVSARTSSGH